MNKITKETKEYMKNKGIPIPPTDYKCQICGIKQKNKTLSYVNSKWICIYMECHYKAMEMKKNNGK